jgi:hypothetical protein
MRTAALTILDVADFRHGAESARGRFGVDRRADYRCGADCERSWMGVLRRDVHSNSCGVRVLLSRENFGPARVGSPLPRDGVHRVY